MKDVKRNKRSEVIQMVDKLEEVEIKKKERRGRLNRQRKFEEKYEDLDQGRLIVVPNENYTGKRQIDLGRRGSASIIQSSPQ